VEGRKPFGTRPGEAIVLNTIKSLRDQGHTLTEIANRMNEEAIPTRAGKSWNVGTLSRILRREDARQ
jgi:hypothetical protein